MYTHTVKIKEKHNKNDRDLKIVNRAPQMLPTASDEHLYK